MASISEVELKRKIYNAKYYEAHKDRGRDRRAEKADYYVRRGKSLKAKYLKENAGTINAKQAMRYARQLRACPAWADLEQIKAIYQEASSRGLEVDHIVPLQGRLVCGLHVQTNLQLLTAQENLKKGNRFPVL